MKISKEKIKILFFAAIFVGVFGLAKCSLAETFFEENFENTNFSSRGWYDVSGGSISTDRVEGNGSFECRFDQGGTGCANGGPGRHLFSESESVYLSYYVKYSDNYIGSGLSYHPHEFHVLTNKDSMWIGPTGTHLTMYVERNHQKPRLAMQDMLNVDTNCIRRNNDTWYSPTGASGCSENYPFTEQRSVASCNGLAGISGSGDCFQWDSTHWYSSKIWNSDVNCFGNSGKYNQNDWNRVEVYFQMNSIQDGIGVPDGVMRYWFNGELIMNYSDILYKTGANFDMKFNQFIIAPYIGDGSPVLQYMWIDDLIVGTSREVSDTTPPLMPKGLNIS